MSGFREHMDAGSLIVLAVTLVLFVTALFVKGLTHELFLEAGVFLVSVKVIMAAHKSRVALAAIEAKLDAALAISERQPSAAHEPNP